MSDFVYLKRLIKNERALKVFDVGSVLENKSKSLYVLFIRENLKVDVSHADVTLFDI